MPTTLFMSITDQNNALLAGESLSTVYNPYTKATVAKPVELLSLGGETEQTFTFGSGTGTGAGKVIFDPFVVSKRVDSVSQALFLAQATGAALKYVDLLCVPTGTGTSTANKPFLSYRLGLVGISDIVTEVGADGAVETVKFEFGTLQIGYQVQKSDGTLGTFAPVGWDRVKNVKL